MRDKGFVLVLSLLFGLGAVAERATSGGGARHLALAPGLSFTDDSSANFPIRGENLAAGGLAGDRPTVVFFGASHCWNTNREAERFVAFAARHPGDVRFLVVDLDHVGPEQRALVGRFYRGSIPTLAFVAASGRVVYDRSGETSSRRRDFSALERILSTAR
jgi:hypothetical protein